ncbi:MAG: sulfite oxidase [Candidatus Limnocylindria bacterium]
MLIRHTDEPPNAETSLAELDDVPVPNDHFYRRCNFPVPDLDVATWHLEVTGAFDHPGTWTLAELGALPAVERMVTLECAGNGRTLMTPIPPGTPWSLGAVGTARFGGVRLADLLTASGLRASAAELVFTGADHGTVEPDGPIAYEFNLDAATATSDGPMLAWTMGREPLPVEHGAPVRLVVPGHYGMRSVKWLTRITAVEVPFEGHFPRKYRYRGEPGTPDETPVGRIRVRSLFTSPSDGAHLSAGRIELRGIAWSGHGRITRVDVQVGGAWEPARLAEPTDGGGPVGWTFDWTPPGPGIHVLGVRAADAEGHVQPESPVWNEGGYGNNLVHRISLTVDGG